MKKINPYILFLVIVALFGCKKDHSNDLKPTVSGKKYALNLNLNVLSQQIEASSNKLSVNAVVSDTASVRSMFTTIGVIIRDSTGNQIFFKKYNAKTYTTGTIRDSLVTGKYTIAIYAGQEGCDIISNFLCYGYQNGGQGLGYNSWKDTFAKVFAVTVQHSDINQTVQLDRIVGEIELDVNDNIPANAYSFTLSRTREDLNYLLFTSALVPGGALYDVKVIIPDTSKNKPNFKFTYITPYTAKSFPVTYTCRDVGGNVISQRVFNSNIVQKNQRLIYKGNFFGTPGTSSDFQPTLSSIWDPNPINISF